MPNPLNLSSRETGYSPNELYKKYFVNSPGALWEADYSAIIDLLNDLPDADHSNLKNYFSHNPIQLDQLYSAHSIIDVNKACMELFECETKEAFLTDFTIGSTSESRSTFIGILNSLLTGAQCFEYETILKTLKGFRRQVKLRFNVQQDEKGNLLYNSILVAITCYTKIADPNLPLSFKHAKDLRYLNMADFLFLSMDSGGIVTMVNVKLSDLLSLPSHEIIGKHWVSHFVPKADQPRQNTLFNMLLSGHIPQEEHIESQILSSRGQRYTISWFTTVMYDEYGEIAEIVATGLNISDQKQMKQEKTVLETRLQQAQRLNSLGILARGVAHEINNPLTGLMNYATILEDEIKIPELRGFAKGIKVEGLRVSEIVTNLLTFARSDNGPRRTVKIKDVIEKAAMLINQSLITDRIFLDLSHVDPQIMVHCLVQDIQHVLLNIVTNSWQAILRKNDDDIERRKIYISTELIILQKKKYVRIEVKDQGDGIAQADLTNVFDPFFSSQPITQGTGLGLAVSYGIVRDHGGKIQVFSTQGKYTKVIVDLPGIDDAESQKKLQ